jgi:hypothetical protein
MLLLCHATVQMGGEGAVSGEDVVLLQMVQYGIKHGTLRRSPSCTRTYDECSVCVSPATHTTPHHITHA